MVRRIDAKTLPGMVLDDIRAKKTGLWQPSAASGPFLGTGYLHDQDTEKGEKRAEFKLKAAKAGPYEVRLSYTPHPNRATNVPVTVRAPAKQFVKTINQKQTPALDDLFVAVGTIELLAGDEVTVTISNEGTDGYVIVDGVQLLPR